MPLKNVHTLTQTGLQNFETFKDAWICVEQIVDSWQLPVCAAYIM